MNFPFFAFFPSSFFLTHQNETPITWARIDTDPQREEVSEQMDSFLSIKELHVRRKPSSSFKRFLTASYR
jgi:hypothetical protein